MGRVSVTTKFKKPTTRKRRVWQQTQRGYADTLNEVMQGLVEERYDSKVTTADLGDNLPSALQNQAIREAKATLKEHGPSEFHTSTPISVNNQNWKIDTTDNGEVAIGFTTTEGRLYCPTHIYYENEEPIDALLDGGETSRLQVYRRGGDWYCTFTVKYDETEAEERTVIGVDLGLNAFATYVEPDSGERHLISGKEYGYTRRQFHSLRKNLQGAGDNGLVALNALGKKESNVIRDKNHKVSREIVEFAKQFPNPVIKMENDLNGLREVTNSREIHSWPFGELKRFTRYKAEKEGIKFREVDQRHTSQRCPDCGHIEKKNRDGIEFECVECGYSDHADFVGATNVALRETLDDW